MSGELAIGLLLLSVRALRQSPNGSNPQACSTAAASSAAWAT